MKRSYPFSLSTGALLAASLICVAAFASACRQKSPEEAFEAARSAYKAELQNFVLREAAADLVDEVTDEATADTGDAASEEEAVVIEPPNPDVLLSVLVSTDSADTLPQLTLDISQADAAGQERQHWRRTVDTSDIQKGSASQLTIVLEDVDFQENDGFHVEVRPSIPMADRGAYPEYAALAS